MNSLKFFIAYSPEASNIYYITVLKYILYRASRGKKGQVAQKESNDIIVSGVKGKELMVTGA